MTAQCYQYALEPFQGQPLTVTWSKSRQHSVNTQWHVSRATREEAALLLLLLLPLLSMAPLM